MSFFVEEKWVRCNEFMSGTLINSDLHPDSNRRPLTSLSQIKVRVKGILKSACFPNSQIIYACNFDALHSFEIICNADIQT
jgi:hypothetical protein